MKNLFLVFVFLLSLSLSAMPSKESSDFYTIVKYNDTQSYPKYITFEKGKVTSLDFQRVIKQVKGMELIDFRLKSVEHESNGDHHYRYVQIAGGLEVVGSMFIAHESGGYIYSANGEVFDMPKTLTAVQQPEMALQSVLLKYPKTVYYFQLENKGNESFYSKPIPELVILPAVLNEVTHTSRVAYAIDLFAATPMSHFKYYVDAVNLKLLFVEDEIHASNVPGKANTKYSGLQDIVTDSIQPSLYQLKESNRGTGNGVETLNMKKGTVYTTALSFNDTDNYWSNFNTSFDEVSGDVHWGTEKTYDFYKNVFNRNSIDNNGFKLTSYVHYSTNYVNAFWNGYFMTYGDGGNGYLPLTSLDVCGHEITHGLTQKTAALIYSNESGALNESFSDIFGVSIDFYTRPLQANFRIGEQFGPGGNALRDMRSPKIYSNPDTYKGQFWINDKSDNGGVHYNSGVQNKWFYLLCVGDTGTNDNGWKYRVDSIGFLKAAQVAYKCLTTFLTPLSGYNDARFYSILAAKQLYGECSFEVKQVMNAWYAVGVGDSSNNLVKAAFNANNLVACKAPLDVKFYNTSTNSNQYIWDFGDGQTSTQPNPTHTYLTQGNYTVKLTATNCAGNIQDSVIQVNYIKIDPNADVCKRPSMPKSGVGEPLTSCSGTLRDDGDTSNYGSLVYSVRSIIPQNTSVLMLTFRAFDVENDFDFVYVYDGPDTLSKLVGKFTGNKLPNGGVIYCRSGAATIRQTSDYLVTGSGFELDWQCISIVNRDCMLEAVNANIVGRKNTSSAFSASEFVPVNIRSRGTNTAANTNLKYQLNNAAVASINQAVVGNGISKVNIGPLDLTTTGNYILKVWIDDNTDLVKENDTVTIAILCDENLPINMPYTEGFETLLSDYLYQKTNGVAGMPRMDYDNTSAQCRMRSVGGGGYIIGGNRSVCLDKSDRNWLFDTFSQSNFVTLTYNMKNMASLNVPVLFRLTYTQHGDRQFPNDALWMRGCDTCNWIKFFDLFANKAAAGTAFTTPLYNLNYYLDSAKQQFTSSFQLRLGQQDQNSAINAIQYTGYSFDNLRFSIWKTGITSTIATSKVEISPNPSTGIFVVRHDQKWKTLKVIDISGREVWSGELPFTEYFELNLSQLRKGVYAAYFLDHQNNTEIRKLIIE